MSEDLVGGVSSEQMAAARPPRLEVRGFAQLEHVDITLGDLTVLVGPQASGKSLVLQLLKLALDGRAIVHTLRDHGLVFRDAASLVERYFGEGMGRTWARTTKVSWRGHAISPDELVRMRQTRQLADHEMYFIPAHRSLALADGYPLAFQQLKAEAPFVVREFSETVRQVLIQREPSDSLFPPDQRLKGLVQAIDDAIFRGARLIDDATGLGRRLQLAIGDDLRLPYMTWTAGQREFIPLLLGAYHLVPKGRTKRAETTYVVIEEPEMGLHPRGILAVMLLVLDLLARGYKVVLSTHAPLVLDVIWGLQRLQRSSAPWQDVLALFGIAGVTRASAGGQANLADAALTKECRTYVLDFDGSRRVTSKDITSLNPSSDDPAIAGWGGLTGMASQIASVVSRAMRAVKSA